MSMFCYQCQETAMGTGCTLKGVCGKTSEVANLQDLLLFVIRGIAVYNEHLRKEGHSSEKADKFIYDSLFITITNANFDKAAIIGKIKEGLRLKKELGGKVSIKNAPDECLWNGNEDEFEEKAKTVGVLRTPDEDIRSLKELVHYGLKGMAAYVDYEVIMGYDQTPGGSRYSGPVSSYSWLKHHIAMLLKQVPNNKLVLGLPFYTRVWTGKEGQAASSVLMMKQIKSLLGQNNIGLFWNPEDRQYVGIWEENGQTRKVWFEERRSLQEKVSLAHDYKLAGLAFWRYGFETEEIYDQIEGAFLNKKDESVRYKNRSEDILIKFRERLKRAQ